MMMQSDLVFYLYTGFGARIPEWVLTFATLVGVYTNFVPILSLTYYTHNLTSMRRVTAVSSLITLRNP